MLWPVDEKVGLDGTGNARETLNPNGSIFKRDALLIIAITDFDPA